MSDEHPKKVVAGQVLPPLVPRTSGMPALPPGTPLGIPLLGRAKFQAHTAVFRSYIEYRTAQRDLYDVETSMVASVEARLEAEKRLAVAVQKHRHLERSLLAEEARFLSELDDEFEAIAEAKATRTLKQRVARANLEAEAIEAEARLDRLRNAQRSGPDPDAGLTRAERTARAIARARKDCDELRRALIDAAGGEDRLTDEDHALLDTIALATENQIHKIVEESL